MRSLTLGKQFTSQILNPLACFLVWINSLLLSKSKAELLSINLCKTTKPLSEKERDWGEVVVCWCFDLFQVRLGRTDHPTINEQAGMEKSGKNTCCCQILVFCFEAVGTLSWSFKSNQMYIETFHGQLANYLFFSLRLTIYENLAGFLNFLQQFNSVLIKVDLMLWSFYKNN